MAETRVYPNFKCPRGLPLLAYWRKYRNDITQDRLASIAGVSQGMISQLETGRSDYTGELLDKLAYALRCEPADLIMRNPLTDPETLWAILDKLKPNTRVVARKMLQALAEQDAA